MTTLEQVNYDELLNIKKLIEKELMSLKNVFPNIQNYKNRFFLEHEDYILALKKDILREKMLAKTIFSESKHKLKMIKKQYKKLFHEEKIDFQYDLYEIKENRRLTLQKIQATSSNYLKELAEKLAVYKVHLAMLKKNKDPQTLYQLDNIKDKIDQLKLSNESIKKQYNYDKTRENAYLQRDKVGFFVRKKKMKEIKAKLKSSRNEKITKNNNKIALLLAEEMKLKKHEISETNDEINKINRAVEATNVEMEKFKLEYEAHMAAKLIEINSVTEKTLKERRNNYNLKVKDIVILEESEINQFKEQHSKSILKDQKSKHLEKMRKYKLDYQKRIKEIKNNEKNNLNDTKQYIKHERIIKKDAKENIKIIKKDLLDRKREFKDKKKNVTAIDDLIKMIKDDVKSANKVIFEQKRTRLFKNINTAYFFIAPAVFGALVFTILPLIFMLVVSMFNLDIVNLGKSQFVGFNNFFQIFMYDIQFRQSLINTLIYALITIGLLSIVTLLMAAWLSKNTKIHNAVTTMVFTPHIASLVAISILWIALLSPAGLINQALAIFGIQGPRWLLQENTSLFSVSMVTVWKDIGYYVLIIIAGLQGIPSYVYEAAKLDKATKAKTFFKVTVPLLAPTLSFVFINKFINSFKVFAPIEIMTNGGPMGSSTVLSYWIYKSGRLGFNYGNAMAGAIILTLIITFFTIINFKFFNRKIEY